MSNLYLALKSPASADNHTVPSSRFTHSSSNADTVSSIPTSPPHHCQKPQSPRTTETKVFSRPPLAHQKSSTSSSAIETLTRQISLSSTGGHDVTSANGQSTIVVKEAKVTPSSELIGAVTRAKDSKH